MGFVGAAMAIAVANAADENCDPYFDVIGIDLANDLGIMRVKKLNNGIFPFKVTDDKLKSALDKALSVGNIFATTDSVYFQKADIVIVDINLDISYRNNNYSEPYVDFSGLKKAITTIGDNIKEDTLVIMETTVPPGTCQMIVKPVLEDRFCERGLSVDKLKIAHSYERVMPGSEYYDSIVNYWRVFSGIGKEAQDACENFLSKVINIKDFPLIKLHSTTASETAKLLENSYRAVNIAFIEEWGRFAEEINIDLFEVIDAIKIRPTHSNIRRPGFGVGGYCLTKDPLFAKVAARDLFGFSDHGFPYCTSAVEINRNMPFVTLKKIEGFLGTLSGKKILVLGISYREDVGDTRNSPVELFVNAAITKRAIIDCYDPLISYWPELKIELLPHLPRFDLYDVIVLTVSHQEFKTLNFAEKVIGTNALIFDANNVLSDVQIDKLAKNSCKIAFIGRNSINA
jgi:nucleotide sugar dehydrogenase